MTHSPDQSRLAKVLYSKFRSRFRTAVNGAFGLCLAAFVLLSQGSSFATKPDRVVESQTKAQSEANTKVQPTAQTGAQSATQAAVVQESPPIVEFPVEKEVLENGLTVLYYVDRSIPLVSYHSTFKVGSKDEQVGLTGMAHLFEHMMFKGSPKYSGEALDKLLQSNGATNNAFTNRDFTGYYIDAPASKLELVMDIESDRMRKLVFDEQALKAEREVVKEERRFRVDENPIGLLFEGLFSLVYKEHSYKWPVIGYMPDLDNVTVDNAQAFHRTFYAPNNAVIALAGDFELSKAKRLVRKYYGSMERQNIVRPKVAVEPSTTQPRSLTLKKDVQSWTIAAAYKAPPVGSDEAFAFEVLAQVLGGGQASRLHKRLVHREQIATQASSSSISMQDSSLFVSFAGLAPGAGSVERFSSAQKAIMGELWKVRNQLIPEAELERAKNQLLKAQVDSLKTLHGKAEALSMNEVLLGDYRRLFSDLGRYMAVTSKQIQDVGKKYLRPEQLHLIVLRPKGDL